MSFNELHKITPGIYIYIYIYALKLEGEKEYKLSLV
jgi:hypothetical protein